MASTEAAIGRDLRRIFDGGAVAGLREAQLLECVARRDDEADAAFEAILTRHGAAVLACCRRVLGDSAAAEDAFQATFLVLFRRAGSIRVGESLAPWLLHVARLVALKARQGESRRRAREHRASRPEVLIPREDASDLHLLVRIEVDRLPGKYADPVRLCYFEGRTHHDAASALGWPVGTVRGRLSRAREMLRTRLGRRGIGITPMAVVAALAAGDEARAEIPRALHEATLAATARGEAIPARIAALATAGARGLSAGAMSKAATVVLLVGVAAAGAGMAALAGREDGSRRRGQPLDATASTRPGIPTVDRHGDPLPKGAMARLGTARFRHEAFEGDFRGVSFTPDGKTLITVGLGEEARAWDVATGHLMRSIEASEAVLARDGRTLFAAKPGLLRAVDLSTGRELRRIAFNPEEQPRKLVISSDGESLAAIVEQVREGGKVLPEPRSALVWYEAATLAERRRIAGDYRFTRDIAFSPDGRVLAVAGPDEKEPLMNMLEPKAATVRLLDVGSGAEVRRIAFEGFGVGSVAFSPDGKVLAAGIGDRTVRLYDAATGREWLPRLGREGAVPPPRKGEGASKGFDLARAAACLAFSPDGSLLASGPEGIGYFGDLVNVPPITLWDVAAARAVRKLAGHPHWINALAFSPDGKTLASVGVEPTARLWDVATGREVDHRDGHPNGIHSLAVSAADGTVFTSGAADGFVIQWDPADGRSLGALGVTPRMFDGMAISADGRTLLIGDPYGPIVWDVVGRRERCRITDKHPNERFVYPAVAPDGRTVTSNLNVWDAATGRRLVSLAKHGWLETTTYTADGRRLISVEQDGVHVWEIATGHQVGQPIRGELVGWFNAAVSPDERLVAVGNVARSQPRLPGQPEPKSDPAIRIWELASGKPVATLLGHTAQSCDLAFSPDGRMLASVSGGRQSGPRTGDRGLRVWEIATGRQVRRLSNYPGGGSLVAYLPDCRSIVTASEDGTALVWDVSDLAERRPSEPPDAKVLESLWSDLASDDAPRGYRASWALSVHGAVPFLRDRLYPAAATEPAVGPEVLRKLRAIAALERVGSLPAREVLENLAQGAAGAQATRDAADALLRLSRKKNHVPGDATAR